MNKHLEAAAKEYYNLFPDGYYNYEYTSTANDAKRQKVFHADPWEKASDRHERCAKTVLPIIRAFLESFEHYEIAGSIKETIEHAEKELKDVQSYGGPTYYE